MSGAYDHLFKLLIIGDSGEWARLLQHFFSLHILTCSNVITYETFLLNSAY